MTPTMLATVKPYMEWMRAQERRYAALARLAFGGCIILPPCSMKPAELRTLNRGAR